MLLHKDPASTTGFQRSPTAYIQNSSTSYWGAIPRRSVVGESPPGVLYNYHLIPFVFIFFDFYIFLMYYLKCFYLYQYLHFLGWDFFEHDSLLFLFVSIFFFLSSHKSLNILLTVWWFLFLKSNILILSSGFSMFLFTIF